MSEQPIHVVGSVDAGERPAPAAHPTSPLAALRARAEQRKQEATVALPVPGSKEWAVRFTREISYDEILKWQRANAKNGQVNLAQVSAVMLANTSLALLLNGEPVELDDEPLTLTSDAFVESQDCVDVVEAIRVFYGGDGPVIATAAGLLREAGYSEEVVADPTQS